MTNTAHTRRRPGRGIGLSCLGALACGVTIAGCSEDPAELRCGSGTQRVGLECRALASAGQGGTDAGATQGGAAEGGAAEGGAGASASGVRCGPGTVLIAGECLPGSGGRGGDDGLIDGAPPLGEAGDSGSGGRPRLECAPAPVEASSAGACVRIGGNVTCNPVTNAGCAGDELCQFVPKGFACIKPLSEPQPACSNCFGDVPVECQAGFTCLGSLGACQRFCCADEDCAPGTTCTLQQGFSVGLCQERSSDVLANAGPPSGAGGAGGAVR